MRVRIKNNSFPNRVLKFLPGRREKCKKVHFTSKENERFLDGNLRKIEKELDNAENEREKKEGKISLLNSEIIRLEKRAGNKTFSKTAIKLCLSRHYIKIEQRKLKALRERIATLEDAWKVMVDNPQEFLRKMGRL